jgi:hypothetical protein
MLHCLNKYKQEESFVGLPAAHRQSDKVVAPGHGLINYIDTKAKCRHLKKISSDGTLRQVFICLRPLPLL